MSAVSSPSSHAQSPTAYSSATTLRVHFTYQTLIYKQHERRPPRHSTALTFVQSQVSSINKYVSRACLDSFARSDPCQRLAPKNAPALLRSQSKRSRVRRRNSSAPLSERAATPAPQLEPLMSGPQARCLCRTPAPRSARPRPASAPARRPAAASTRGCAPRCSPRRAPWPRRRGRRRRRG